MELHFEKYQGAGNDFIMVDQRNNKWIHHYDQSLIEKLCDRRFGIGADGLIILEGDDNFDFKMVYFNADGRESSMCGNGGRCIVSFAHSLGMIQNSTTFEAIDGIHHAEVLKDGMISLQMSDVQDVLVRNEHDYTLNTGSPHFVRFGSSIPQDINAEGKKIRYSDEFKDVGINVNYVEILENQINVATYERGVEDETLSCGTGVTGAAIALAVKEKYQGSQLVNINTKGGKLSVRFDRLEGNNFKNVWLTGPATFVFRGVVEI